jgi:hypothetical protein
LNDNAIPDLTYYGSTGIVVGFKPNGQAIIGIWGETSTYSATDKQTMGGSKYSGIALRISKGKVSSAGIFTPSKSVGGFETADYNTLVIDRYTGQTKIYPNK